MSDRPKPPIPKYRLTITITANAPEELERELDIATNSFEWQRAGRDAMDSTNGICTVLLEHTNAEQTPEAYRRQLDEWWQADRAWRKQKTAEDET